MRIVIDIDENVFTRLFDNGDEYVVDMRRACVAIRKGTPLPKGHGRLIDADALGEKLHRYTEAPYQYALTVFGESPTIIEADKAESEGENE